MAREAYLPLLIPALPFHSVGRPTPPPPHSGPCRGAVDGTAPWSSVVRILLLLLAGMLPSLAADVASLPEHRVRALYLYNFTHYVTWPGPARSEAGSSRTNFVVGVSNDPDIERDLRELGREKKAQGRPLVVRRLSTPDEVALCDLVYVGGTDDRHCARFVQAAQGTRALTVGESDAFLRLGGMIQLYRKDQNMRLRIHVPNATQAGFTINVRLLTAAEVIR